MRKNTRFLLILAGIIYTIVFLLYISKITVIAAELKEEVTDVMKDQEELINGFVSLDEEDQEDSDNVLSDTYTPIKEYSDKDQEDQEDHKESDIIQEDRQEDEEVISEDPTPAPDPTPGENTKFYYMVIFCFGLIGGVIAGDILTRFIKR